MSETVTAPVETAPVVDAAPAVEAAAVAPAEAALAPVASPEPAPATVLGEAPPVEAAPVAEAQPVVESQSDEPAPLPTFEPFALPEGMQPNERFKEVTDLLGQFELNTKADHAEVHKLGQELLNRHVAEIQRAVEEVRQHYATAAETQKAAWKDAFLADPEIGGNRFQTTVDAARSFLRTHGGSDEQQAEFRQLMNDTGLGNHPAIIRLLARAGAAMSEGRPLAAPAPMTAPKSKTEALYGRRVG